MVVSFFNEKISIEEIITIAIVENPELDTGKNTVKIIRDDINKEGIFVRNSINLIFFCNPKKIKHPEDISQNLAGIRK